MHDKVADSNERYAVTDRVSFESGPAGLTVMRLKNAHGEATLLLQGAQVLSWIPSGQAPVVWTSPSAIFAPGRAPRGGIPVCWPWFGPHASESGWPVHGFARTAQWAVVETADDAQRTRVVLRMNMEEKHRAMWPHASQLELHVALGTALELELLTRNLDAAPFTIGEALHTYFAVGDVRQAAVTGLEGCRYFDKVAGDFKHQDVPVSVSGEVDRVFMNTEADCAIDDAVLRRRLIITKRGSRSTVVWNPWIEKALKLGDMGDDGYLRMLCVESANALDDQVTVKPGGEHRLWVRYEVAPFA